MNDFLKNLRNTGKDNRPLKRPSSYNSTRYHYESQKKHHSDEKRNGQDRRTEEMAVAKSQESIAASIVEIAPAIIEFMEIVAKSRKRVAEAEERKASAIENIFKELKETGIESLLGLQASKKSKKVKKPFDQHRKKILQLISKLRNKGETFDNIALYLQKESLKTFSGRGQWHAQTVHRLYQDYILD